LSCASRIADAVNPTNMEGEGKMPGRRCLSLWSFLVVAVFAFHLAGCAVVSRPTRSLHYGDADAPGRCADFFASMDQQASKARVLDAGAFRVEGYPYLRVNRFLASFRNEVAGNDAFAAWVNRMQALDQEARRAEIANLPRAAADSSSELADQADLNVRVAGCGNLLKAADFNDGEKQAALQKNVTVPDEYLVAPRILGRYLLTGLLVSHGVSNWHAEVRRTFSTEPPVGRQSIRYAPEKSSQWADPGQIVKTVKRDALGIPNYPPSARKALFSAFAPIWEVRSAAGYDRIGEPSWATGNELTVDTRKHVTYTLLSFTRFGEEILTQLNYIIWFPERPRANPLDLYGGLLDGVNYRVTLDNDGEPLLYETIHNCGCYYKAYPTRRLKVRQEIEYAEKPLILQEPDLTPSKEMMAVSMESRTHYVRRLYPISRLMQLETARYSFADYNRLRSLPVPGDGHRSMFGEDSLAPGSERLERLILWPTGVVSPGAMRQWGRHAVAFVGKRHFDDPFALEKMFTEADCE